MITCVRRRRQRDGRNMLRICLYVRDKGLGGEKCYFEHVAKDLGIKIRDVIRAAKMLAKAGVAQLGND